VRAALWHISDSSLKILWHNNHGIFVHNYGPTTWQCGTGGTSTPRNWRLYWSELVGLTELQQQWLSSAGYAAYQQGPYTWPATASWHCTGVFFWN